MKICSLNVSLTLYLAIVEVGSPEPDLLLMVNDPKGKQLESKVPFISQLTLLQEGESKIRYQFTAFVGGNYQVCVTNKRPNSEVEFDFMIQTGIEAKDYSNIITKKHLKPIELQAQKVQDMVKQLRQELSFLVANEENLKE